MKASLQPVQSPNPLRQIARRMLAAFLPRRLFLVRGSQRSGQVCLTFDDGPHPVYTPALLDELSALRIKATFFVIGREAALYPEIVRRIVADGHAVGNHSWSHQHPLAQTSAEFVDEVRRTDTFLAELTGRRTALLRPPHGKLSTGQLCRILGRRRTIVLWNSDPKDFARQSPNDLLEYFQYHPLQSGDIILLHDNHPHAAGAMRHLVKDVKSRNLSFATPEDWVSFAT